MKKVFKNGGGKRFQFPLNKGQKKVKNSCHFFFQIYDAVWWSSKKMQHVKWKEWKSHKTYIKDVLRWCRNAIVEEGFWWWGKYKTVTIIYMRPTENGALETVLPQLSMNSASLWKKNKNFGLRFHQSNVWFFFSFLFFFIYLSSHQDPL